MSFNVNPISEYVVIGISMKLINPMVGFRTFLAIIVQALGKSSSNFGKIKKNQWIRSKMRQNIYLQPGMVISKT